MKYDYYDLNSFKYAIYSVLKEFYLFGIYYDPIFFLNFPVTGWYKNNESYSWVEIKSIIIFRITSSPQLSFTGKRDAFYVF